MCTFPPKNSNKWIPKENKTKTLSKLISLFLLWRVCLHICVYVSVSVVGRQGKHEMQSKVEYRLRAGRQTERVECLCRRCCDGKQLVQSSSCEMFLFGMQFRSVCSRPRARALQRGSSRLNKNNKKVKLAKVHPQHSFSSCFTVLTWGHSNRAERVDILLIFILFSNFMQIKSYPPLAWRRRRRRRGTKQVLHFAFEWNVPRCLRFSTPQKSRSPAKWHLSVSHFHCFFHH